MGQVNEGEKVGRLHARWMVKIAISLIDTKGGKQTAQARENAWLHQRSAPFLISAAYPKKLWAFFRGFFALLDRGRVWIGGPKGANEVS
jgi:hypothetical protein